MPGQTETRLSWGQDTITIKGQNAGIPALTVHFEGEALPIIDFLNHSLNAEHAALYEAVMSTYEPRLKSGSLFDHGFPETTFPGPHIDPCQLSAPQPAADKVLIETLLKEYNTCLDHIKAHFKDYEKIVKNWFDSLPAENKK